MLELTFCRDGHVTKNTIRYEEVHTGSTKPKEREQQVILNKLYISKAVLSPFGHLPPVEITVKLDW